MERKCPLHGCACRIADLGLRCVGRFAPVLQAAAQKLAPRNRKMQGASAHRIQVAQSSAWTTGKDGSRFHVNRMRGWNGIPFCACTNRRRLCHLATPGTLAPKSEKSQNASFPPDKHTHGCAWSRRARKSARHDNQMRGSSGVCREAHVTGRPKIRRAGRLLARASRVLKSATSVNPPGMAYPRTRVVKRETKRCLACVSDAWFV